MIRITSRVSLGEDEYTISAVRAQGAGGQNVNKVATAIHLRFDIKNSSLPETWKSRLLALNDRRISKEGVLIIKSQQFRTQEKNRMAAVDRLQTLIAKAATAPKPRKPTRPTKKSKEERITSKKRRGEIKNLRAKPRQNGPAE